MVVHLNVKDSAECAAEKKVLPSLPDAGVESSWLLGDLRGGE